MNTRIEKASARTPKPVEVTITVRKFKDVLVTAAARGGRATDYAMKLGSNDPRAEIKGNDIYIKRPGATLRFTIASSAADQMRYYPIGISFLREGDRSSSDAQRLGLLNFPQNQTRMDGPTLTITDAYKDEARYVRYKFSVVVQRGSDGRIGIIDPGIVHEFDE